MTRWRKSSYSNGQGECVEVTAVSSVIAVRDSKAPEGTPVTITLASWWTLLNAIKAGELDL
jgi:hypothetical protein